jgi:hypothetical protein
MKATHYILLVLAFVIGYYIAPKGGKLPPINQNTQIDSLESVASNLADKIVLKDIVIDSLKKRSQQVINQVKGYSQKQVDQMMAQALKLDSLPKLDSLTCYTPDQNAELLAAVMLLPIKDSIIINQDYNIIALKQIVEIDNKIKTKYAELNNSLAHRLEKETKRKRNWRWLAIIEGALLGFFIAK